MNCRLLQKILCPPIIHKHITHSLLQKYNFPQITTRIVHTNGPFPDKPNVLVYKGPLNKRIKIVKLVSLSSSVLGLSLLPIVLKDLVEVSMALSAGVALISCAFLSTPLLVNFVTKRYVLQLDYDPRTKLFTAKTFNLLALERELKFTASEVFVPDLPGFLSSFEVNGIPLFVDAGLIEDPDAYSHMMGYDKPLDLLLQREEDKKP